MNGAHCECLAQVDREIFRTVRVGCLDGVANDQRLETFADQLLNVCSKAKGRARGAQMRLYPDAALQRRISHMRTARIVAIRKYGH